MRNIRPTKLKKLAKNFGHRALYRLLTSISRKINQTDARQLYEIYKNGRTVKKIVWAQGTLTLWYFYGTSFWLLLRGLLEVIIILAYGKEFVSSHLIHARQICQCQVNEFTWQKILMTAIYPFAERVQKLPAMSTRHKNPHKRGKPGLIIYSIGETACFSWQHSTKT